MNHNAQNTLIGILLAAASAALAALIDNLQKEEN